MADQLSFDKPVYRNICSGNFYMSCVKVGPHSVGSVIAFSSEESASEAAAKNALAILNKHYSNALSSSFASNGKGSSNSNGGSGGANFEQGVKNILTLLGEHSAGLYNYSLAAKYSERFGKSLPENWLQRIESDQWASQQLSFTHMDETRCIVAVRKQKSTTNSNMSTSQQYAPPSFDLRQKLNESKASRTPASEENSSSPRNPNPDPMVLPDSNYFDIEVSLIRTPADFVFTIKGDNYDRRLADLCVRMNDFYSNNKSATRITNSAQLKSFGHLYAVDYDDAWHRVSLVEILDDESTTMVYFIDNGDCVKVQFEQMRRLETEFIRLPPQAVKGCLKGFENWMSDDFDEEIIEQFETLVFDAKLLSCQISYDVDDRSYDNSTLSLALLAEISDDVKKYFNLPKNVVDVNDFVLQSIQELVDALEAEADEEDDESSSPADDDNENNCEPKKFDNFSPRNETQVLKCFTEIDDELDVLVVFAVDPSNFMVQPSSLIRQLKTMTFSLSESYGRSNATTPNEKVVAARKSQFYAAFTNNAWFRAYCTSDENPNSVTLFLVDYGEFSSCSTSNLRYLLPQFCSLPMLSIRCSLIGVLPYEKQARSYSQQCSFNFCRKVTDKVYKAIVKTKTLQQRQTSDKPPFPSLEIDLYDKANGENLTDWLVKMKYVSTV